MPETPDFATIAEQLVPAPYVEFVRDALRLMWNTRGAADIAKLEWAFGGVQPSMKTIDRALRSLDQ